MPPMRKLWPVVRGYPEAVQTSLHLARKVVFVSMRGPEGVEYARSGRLPGRVLVARWEQTWEIGSRESKRETSTTFCPFRLVFVRGRLSV